MSQFNQRDLRDTDRALVLFGVEPGDRKSLWVQQL